MSDDAGIAQLVERNLAKVEVASSRLVSRSNLSRESRRSPFAFLHLCRRSGDVSATHPGGVAEWSCSGLQSRLRRFDSDPRLQTTLSDLPAVPPFACVTPAGRFGGHLCLDGLGLRCRLDLVKQTFANVASRPKPVRRRRYPFRYTSVAQKPSLRALASPGRMIALM